MHILLTHLLVMISFTQRSEKVCLSSELKAMDLGKYIM